MLTVTTREAIKWMKIALELNDTVVLLGNPGIGKTEIVSQIAQELEYVIYTFEAPSLDPTDVRGVMIPIGEESIFTRSPLYPKGEDTQKKGILFIDELLSAKEMVQVALHPVFQQKCVGQHKLPPTWRVIAAGNIPRGNVFAKRMISTLATRALVLEVVSDLRVWIEDYAIPKGIDTRILGFLMAYPSMFDCFPNEVDEVTSTYPNPRAWTKLSEYLQVSGDELPPLSIIRGKVGGSAAQKFYTFLEVSKTREFFDIVQSLQKGEAIKKSTPNEIVIAAVLSIISQLINTKTPQERRAMAKPLLSSLNQSQNLGELVAVCIAVYLAKYNEIKTLPEYTLLFSKLYKHIGG